MSSTQPRFKAKKILKYKREKIPLSHKEMAATVTLISGYTMSAPYYEKIEAGKRVVGLDHAIAICKIFPDVQIDELWMLAKDVENVEEIHKNKTVVHTKEKNEKKE